jgi:hypothetical protein
MAIARAMSGRRTAIAIAIPIFARLWSRLPRHTQPWNDENGTLQAFGSTLAATIIKRSLADPELICQLA